MNDIFKKCKILVIAMVLAVLTVTATNVSFADSPLQTKSIPLLDDHHNDDDHSYLYDEEAITDFDLSDFKIINQGTYDKQNQTFFESGLDFVLPEYYPVVVEKDTKRYVMQTLRDGTQRLIVMRNGHLANMNHPVTNIPYDNLGFPIFESVHTLTIDNRFLKENNAIHFKLCNIDLKEAFLKDPDSYPFTASQRADVLKGKKPKGYTWHHHENRGLFYLVSTSLHSKSGHTGGRAIWGS